MLININDFTVNTGTCILDIFGKGKQGTQLGTKLVKCFSTICLQKMGEYVSYTYLKMLDYLIIKGRKYSNN